MLRIFTAVKIQRLRPGLNPRAWVPEASMLTTKPPKPSLSQLSYESMFFYNAENTFGAVCAVLPLLTSLPLHPRARWNKLADKDSGYTKTRESTKLWLCFLSNASAA